jgi:hypothetical protein
MIEHFTSCACGRLRLSCQGDPTRVSMCHCLDCQRRTGSLFSIAAFFERSAVTVVDGASKTFTRNSVTGKDVTFHFAPNADRRCFGSRSACRS